MPLKDALPKIDRIHLLTVYLEGPEEIRNPRYESTASMSIHQPGEYGESVTALGVQAAGGRPRAAEFRVSVKEAYHRVRSEMEDLVRHGGGSVFAPKSDTESLPGYAEAKDYFDRELPVTRVNFLGADFGPNPDQVFRSSQMKSFLKANPREAFVVAYVFVQQRPEMESFDRQLQDGVLRWQFSMSVPKPDIVTMVSPILLMRYAGSEANLVAGNAFTPGPVMEAPTIRVPVAQTRPASLTITSWGSTQDPAQYVFDGGDYNTSAIDPAGLRDMLVEAGTTAASSAGSGLAAYVEEMRAAE